MLHTLLNECSYECTLWLAARRIPESVIFCRVCPVQNQGVTSQLHPTTSTLGVWSNNRSENIPVFGWMRTAEWRTTYVPRTECALYIRVRI